MPTAFDRMGTRCPRATGIHGPMRTVLVDPHARRAATRRGRIEPVVLAVNVNP